MVAERVWVRQLVAALVVAYPTARVSEGVQRLDVRTVATGVPVREAARVALRPAELLSGRRPEPPDALPAADVDLVRDVQLVPPKR